MAGVTSVVIDGTTYLVDDINAVDFSEEQELTEQQQQQGRSNIGAAALAALAGKADKADLDALEGTVGELSDDVDGLTEALADKASAIVDTASGTIASFPDGAAVAAKDITIGIEPVQDLHGYANPWPGGSGKNLLQLTVDTIKSLNGGASSWTGNQKTVNGVVVTILTDVDDNVIGIRANGTANAHLNILLATKTLIDALGGGSFILSGSPAGGATDGSTYFVGFYAPGKAVYDFGSGTTMQLSGAEDSSANIYLRVANNYHANNIVFKPMIRLSTVSDATFAPYSNICPISGWTGANVMRTGKNVYKMRSTSSSASGITITANSDGTLSISGTTGDSAYSVSLYDPAIQSRISELLAKGGTFCMSMNKGTYNSTTLNVSLTYKETPGGPNKFITPTGNPVTIPAGSIWGGSSNLWVPANTTIQTLDHWFIQLEVASTPSTPVPYTGTTIPISWQSEAGTVYGGTLDVTKGLLTVDKGIAVFSSSASTGVNRNSAKSYYISPTAAPGILIPGVNQDSILSNVFKSSTSISADGIVFLNAVGAIRFNTIKDYATVAKMLTDLGEIEFVYPLATPQTYQLTPTEVEMLLGENNVWADTGDSTVAYRADTKLYIQKINAPTDDDMIADAQIASGKYFIVGGNLYKSTTTIPAGDTITPGTNCILTNLADALNALNT